MCMKWFKIVIIGMVDWFYISNYWFIIGDYSKVSEKVVFIVRLDKFEVDYSCYLMFVCNYFWGNIWNVLN